MTRIRHDLTFEMTPQEVIATMSEGNPGAVSAMLALCEGSAATGLLDVFRLDDLNIRGPQVHVAYKDWAGRDIEKFRNGIRDKDQGMIDVVNRECAYLGVLASRFGRQ